MSHLRIWRFDHDCQLIVQPGVSTAVLPATNVVRPSDRADSYLRSTEVRTGAATAMLLRELKRQATRFYGVALVRCPGHTQACESAGQRAYLISFAVLGPRNTIVHGDTTARTLGLAQHYTQRYLASVRSGQPDEQLLARM